MNLIFMGTPDFAVPALEALVNAGHTIMAVYSQPSKPKGRGLTVQLPPVAEKALSLGLPVFQPASVRGEEVCRDIAALNADCIVVVAYGKLLPTAILNAARYGCVNVHSSLLPKYRGSAPINWAVINGETETGVSTMRLDEGMDTGDILLQSKTPIYPDESAGELHDRLADMGARLIVETLEKLEKGEITPIKQDDSLSCHAPMLDKSLCAVDWTMDAQAVHNKIRGLSPWPVALCQLGGKRVKLHRSRIAEGSGQPGEIISVAPLTIACGSGAVEILELQGEGGKRMPSADYLRGHAASVGELAQ